MIYKNKITRVDTLNNYNGNNTIVYKVQWLCCCVDELTDMEETIVVTTELPIKTTGLFTDFHELTEANVMSWVLSCVDINEIQEKALRKMEVLQSGIETDVSMPWGINSQLHYDDNQLIK